MESSAALAFGCVQCYDSSLAILQNLKNSNYSSQFIPTLNNVTDPLTIGVMFALIKLIALVR